MNLTLLGFCLLGIIIALGQAQRFAGRAGASSKKDERAPNPNPNCDCQCDSYIWKDSNKKTMGNYNRQKTSVKKSNLKKNAHTNLMLLILCK